jgi:hypothetical protein
MLIAAYRAFLWLYPARYRQVFGWEMAHTFAQAEQACSGRLPFGAREFAGLLKGLFNEWLSKWANPNGYLHSVDPEFRGTRLVGQGHRDREAHPPGHRLYGICHCQP